MEQDKDNSNLIVIVFLVVFGIVAFYVVIFDREDKKKEEENKFEIDLNTIEIEDNNTQTSQETQPDDNDLTDIITSSSSEQQDDISSLSTSDERISSSQNKTITNAQQSITETRKSPWAQGRKHSACNSNVDCDDGLICDNVSHVCGNPREVLDLCVIDQDCKSNKCLPYYSFYRCSSKRCENVDDCGNRSLWTCPFNECMKKCQNGNSCQDAEHFCYDGKYCIRKRDIYGECQSDDHCRQGLTCRGARCMTQLPNLNEQCRPNSKNKCMTGTCSNKTLTRAPGICQSRNDQPCVNDLKFVGHLDMTANGFPLRDNFRDFCLNSANRDESKCKQCVDSKNNICNDKVNDFGTSFWGTCTPFSKK